MRQLGRLKKFFAGVLAAAMVFTTGVGVMADTTDTAAKDGSITIENAIKDMTYDVYRVFDFEGSTVSANGNYANGVYRLSSKWEGFTNEFFDVNGSDKTLKFKGDFISEDEAKKEAAAKKFAAAALKYAKDESHKITADLSQKATSDKVEFTGLELGYYLVDSSAGAALSLDTTIKHATIREKNDVPTIDKQVSDNNTGLGKSNDVNVGDIVAFQITVNAKNGAQNYVVHDKMSAGLAYDKVTSVKSGSTTLTEGTEYEVVKAPSDGCTFEVVFKQSYLDTITADTSIVIDYQAVVTKDAVIAPSANINDAQLKYGDDNETEWSHTDTYVYKFDLHKYAANDTTSANLAGAKFKLLDKDKNDIKLVKVSEGVYGFDVKGDVTEFETIKDKDIEIIGLDEGHYYLEETEAPSGYNKLDGLVDVIIRRQNKDAGENYLVNEKADHTVYIANNTGSILPSTGGIGTTIFYLVGGLLIIGAFVSFIVRRKMAD